MGPSGWEVTAILSLSASFPSSESEHPPLRNRARTTAPQHFPLQFQTSIPRIKVTKLIKTVEFSQPRAGSMHLSMQRASIRTFLERLAMIEVGQEVTVITEKGTAYNGFVMASATSSDGTRAYKISVDGGGLQQLGQWHKAGDVFVLDPLEVPQQKEPLQMRSFLRH
jgi:hypothetical protein